MKRRKIAVDITSFSDQYKDRGIGTYARNVVSELIKSDDFEWHLLGFVSSEHLFKKEDMFFHSLGEPSLSTPKNFFRFKSSFLPLIEEIKTDLYFAPHFERGLPIGSTKVALMIHDVSPFLSSKYSTKGFFTNLLKGIFYKYNLGRAKLADLVLTNSNFTKEELVKIGFRRESVIVTHLGLSKDFDLSGLEKIEDRGSILKKYGITKPYILYYGGFEPNKNTDKLFEVFAKVRTETDVKLVIADKNFETKDGVINAKTTETRRGLDKIENLDLKNDVIIKSFFNWRDLPIICAEAYAFVHLSNYEGFGLAILEAMSSGCPLIAADRSSYPEVVGDAGLLVDPDDVDSTAKAVLSVITDEMLREKLRIAGKKRSKIFSWEACADQTLAAFKNILDK
ncbi:MAG: glycosyltransferase family 1 protein [Patescibacteria group bacterium]|nr:glycosyltransferase family 4 protein [Patescibacteria group bacterium]